METQTNTEAGVNRAKELFETGGKAAKPISKAEQVRKLLSRPRGATVDEIITATTWKPHSVRAFLSGLRKGGTNLVREERKGGSTSYRIAKLQKEEPVTPPADGAA